MHDADAFQGFYLIPEDFAHPSYLSVESLFQDDAKSPGAFLPYEAGFRSFAEDIHTISHCADHVVGEFLIHRDNVFFFVVVSCPEDLIDDIPVIGEQDQSFRILVEPADREDAFGMIDESDDIGAVGCIRGGCDAGGFVQCDVDGFLGTLYFFTIDGHPVAGINPCCQQYEFIVDGDTSLFDQFFSFPAGAEA